MIREYKASDLDAIVRLHEAEGRPFQLPRIDSPLMLVRQCFVDEHDEVKLAAFGRLHISALLFVDKTWNTPQERLDALKLLQVSMMKKADSFGLDIATTQADGRFAERLQDELGWTPGLGKMFYREIKP